MKIVKELIPYVIIVIIVVLLRTFIITPVRVDGDSMYPTLKDGEILILEKYSDNYKRNDIVVVTYNGEKLIKRIIALPGETISYLDNVLYINEKPTTDVVEDFTSDFYGITLKENEYFVLGDNRTVSKDSRTIGPINKDDIIGKTRLRIFPLDKINIVK